MDNALADGLKELNLYKSIKVIISPSHNIADDWMVKLKLDENCKVIIDRRSFNGEKYKRDEVLVLFGEKFNYPENVLATHVQISQFHELIEDIERRYL